MGDFSGRKKCKNWPQIFTILSPYYRWWVTFVFIAARFRVKGFQSEKIPPPQTHRKKLYLIQDATVPGFCVLEITVSELAVELAEKVGYPDSADSVVVI